jgi:hypothetical protein
VARQIWWTTVPIWSIGFLSFVPFLTYALIRRRKRDWAVFAGYLAATVAMIVALGSVRSGSGADTALGGFIVALAGCAAAHACVLFRPSAGLAPLLGTSAAPTPPLELARRQRNRAALAEAQGAIERRKDARRLAATDPDLARELMIGRPDLTREYDDGGLVDVNHVPGIVLAGNLGLTPDETRDVLAARDKLGRFTSAEELCAYTSLSPGRVDELRDLMTFT